MTPRKVKRVGAVTEMFYSTIRETSNLVHFFQINPEDHDRATTRSWTTFLPMPRIQRPIRILSYCRHYSLSASDADGEAAGLGIRGLELLLQFGHIVLHRGNDAPGHRLAFTLQLDDLKDVVLKISNHQVCRLICTVVDLLLSADLVGCAVLDLNQGGYLHLCPRFPASLDFLIRNGKL